MEQVLFNPDLIAIIFSQYNIPTAPDYKAIIATCHIWYNTLKSKSREHTFMNVISTFIKQNMNMCSIIQHFGRSLTLDIITANIDKIDVAHNPRLTLTFIREFKDKISMTDLLCDQYLSIEILREFKDELNWNNISYYYPFTYEIYKEFEQYITNGLWVNPHLTWDIVDNVDITSFSYMFLTNIEFDYKRFANFIDRYHRWISQNPHLTPQFIRDFADKLNWDILSMNRALTLSLIREFIDRVDWRTLSRNINLDEEFIYNNIDKIDMFMLQCNLSYEFICKFENKLSWFGIANNPTLTLETIDKYKETHLKKYWTKWIVYPCITIDYLTQNRDFIIEISESYKQDNH